MDKKPWRTTRSVVNLRQGRNDWYRIANSAAGGTPATLHVYDEIGYFGITANDLITDLTGVKGDLDVHINSPGGEVYDGLAIYEALAQRPGIVSVTVDSLAASIASVIAMAASPGRLLMAKNARLMIHDGFGMAIGNAADMRAMAELLDDASDNIASIYAERSGRPAAEWRDIMRNEKWYSAQAAMDAGLADGIAARPRDADAEQVPVNSWDLSIFGRAAAQAAGSTVPDAEPVQDEAEAPAVTNQASTDHEPDDDSWNTELSVLLTNALKGA